MILCEPGKRSKLALGFLLEKNKHSGNGQMLIARLFAASFAALLSIQAMAQQQQIQSAGVNIHFTDEGSGQAVVLLHGFAANANMNWRMAGITGTLAEKYRVIAVDFRGHGASDKPHETGAYGLEMMNDVIRILDHLEIDKAHIVGYSMGGFVTMKLMAEHPERVISATLGGSGGIRDDFDHSWDDAMAEQMEAGKSFADALQSSLPEGQKLEENEVAMLRLLFQVQDNAALVAVLRSWKELAVSYQQLENNQIPTLVVYGSEEDDKTRPWIEGLQGRMANAEFHMIEGANHLTTIPRPEFREAILKFIETHSDYR